jgi:hypothetical protein
LIADDDRGTDLNRISMVQVPTLMADLLEYVDGSKVIKESLSGQGESNGEGVFGVDEEGRLKQNEREDKVKWMRGKTVVLYGDSVQRYNLDHFCKVGANLGLISNARSVKLICRLTL